MSAKSESEYYFTGRPELGVGRRFVSTALGPGVVEYFKGNLAVNPDCLLAVGGAGIPQRLLGDPLRVFDVTGRDPVDAVVGANLMTRLMIGWERREGALVGGGFLFEFYPRDRGRVDGRRIEEFEAYLRRLRRVLRNNPDGENGEIQRDLALGACRVAQIIFQQQVGAVMVTDLGKRRALAQVGPHNRGPYRVGRTQDRLIRVVEVSAGILAGGGLAVGGVSQIVEAAPDWRQQATHSRFSSGVLIITDPVEIAAIKLAGGKTRTIQVPLPGKEPATPPVKAPEFPIDQTNLRGFEILTEADIWWINALGFTRWAMLNGWVSARDSPYFDLFLQPDWVLEAEEQSVLSAVGATMKALSGVRGEFKAGQLVTAFSPEVASLLSEARTSAWELADEWSVSGLDVTVVVTVVDGKPERGYFVMWDGDRQVGASWDGVNWVRVPPGIGGGGDTGDFLFDKLADGVPLTPDDLESLNARLTVQASPLPVSTPEPEFQSVVPSLREWRITSGWVTTYQTESDKKQWASIMPGRVFRVLAQTGGRVEIEVAEENGVTWRCWIGSGDFDNLTKPGAQRIIMTPTGELDLTDRPHRSLSEGLPNPVITGRVYDLTDRSALEEGVGFAWGEIERVIGWEGERLKLLVRLNNQDFPVEVRLDQSARMVLWTGIPEVEGGGLFFMAGAGFYHEPGIEAGSGNQVFQAGDFFAIAVELVTKEKIIVSSAGKYLIRGRF